MTNTLAEEGYDTLHVVYRAFCRFGVVVFRCWAAVVGCDISVSATGIPGVGPKAMEEALDATMTSEWNAFNLLHSFDSEIERLIRVNKWFGIDGQYYDNDANIRSIAD